jgi:hypothetical protein
MKDTDLIWDVEAVEIDPATAAVDTGTDDMNHKRIYGSTGEFHGGDRVRMTHPSLPPVEGIVVYESPSWFLRTRKGRYSLAVSSAELEIIPQGRGIGDSSRRDK